MPANEVPHAAIVVSANGDKALKSAAATLSKTGFTVLTASDATGAMLQCQESLEPVDLAVVDADLPGLDGEGMLQQLYAMCPGIRLLVLSETDEGSELGLWQTRGHIRRALRKPVRRSQFLGQVLEMMEQPLVLTA